MSAATKDATKAAGDLPGAANNALATGDAAKSDVAGNRKPGAGTDGTPAVATPAEEKPSSLKIHIKLDLDVDIHLTARVKGDITIGLL